MPDEIPVVTPVVETAEQTPAIAIHTAEQGAELPQAAMHATFTALNGTLEKLNSTLEKVLKQTEDVAVEPVDAATDTVEDVVPDVETPKANRFVRRGGRKVKRA